MLLACILSLPALAQKKDKCTEAEFRLKKQTYMAKKAGLSAEESKKFFPLYFEFQDKKKEINRIILTRPAVEAGESLGFLPGDLQEKVDPYLRPLYDALFEMLGGENFSAYQEKGMIEVAPLAYMRGRTLDNSFIILDEAQNTTKEQMKMFLTRIGFNSKAVITGDITQIDLPNGKVSGLKDAIRIIKNIEDISIFNLSEKDVVRHPLIQKIIKAYERADLKK